MGQQLGFLNFLRSPSPGFCASFGPFYDAARPWIAVNKVSRPYMGPCLVSVARFRGSPGAPKNSGSGF